MASRKLTGRTLLIEEQSDGWAFLPAKVIVAEHDFWSKLIAFEFNASKIGVALAPGGSRFTVDGDGSDPVELPAGIAAISSIFFEKKKEVSG